MTMFMRKRDTALLALEDGTRYWGKAVGRAGETFGELVFNTGMTGYQEVLTDPSYYGQIAVMTYPEIGIYGVNPEDVESRRIQVAGFVVHRAVDQPCNQRATSSFPDYLQQAGIVAIEGVDTRALTRQLRSQGVMRGAISTVDLDPQSLVFRIGQQPPMLGQNLAQAVSPTPSNARSSQKDGHFHVVVVDAGAKQNIVRDLEQHQLRVTAVPYDADLTAVLVLKPDGVLISNGPGDPAVLECTILLVRGLLKYRIPLVGICLGHQILGLALGGRTYKMRFGHRGSNHPVKDLDSGRVLITTQNHGFAINPISLGIDWVPLERREINDESQTMAETLPARPLVGESSAGYGRISITHLSLNDGTLEGLRLHDYPAFSVQFHPEAAPGPHDAKAFFAQFTKLMEDHHA